ncbi:hypothetical protein Pint_17683 [Pistacia integerrima]|uniref:Uncharacterized protein n=1 Tax=Pistacia integerrima TaxID=434235 RepID=A0ACC0YWU2_9ROSI|nr:hypothetical protein Pint_17683 [Pistacia integerrima]
MKQYLRSFDEDIEEAMPLWQQPYEAKPSRLQGLQYVPSLTQFKGTRRKIRSPVLPVTSFYRSVFSVIDTLLYQMTSIHHLLSRNWILLSFCLAAIFLDPFFLYIPVINDHKKCLGLDKILGTAVIVVRSFFDFFDFIYIIFQLRTYSPRNLNKRGVLNDKSWATARKYLLYSFPIDLLSILPLPQVLIYILIRGWKLRNAMKLLQYFVIFQYVPRLIRIYPLFRKVKKTFGNLYDSRLTKVAFNLLLYVLASHVYGSLWYFLAIDRETVCWKRACANHPGCGHSSLYCHDTLGDTTFLNDLCPTKPPNTTMFDFGMYQDALQSGIVEVTDLPQKFLYSFLWGLQNLR